MYLDFEFFRTLEQQLQSPGEFAKAYVIAHEVGHHIQKLEGTSDKMDAMRRKVSEKQYNQLSVRLELQADCYAGVWAHHANVDRQILESGDIESALNAAAQIGDDALQRSAAVDPATGGASSAGRSTGAPRRRRPATAASATRTTTAASAACPRLSGSPS